ncbi:MAG: 3-keto-disaccharide hydrolase [Planctomycetota bacterium]|jgi:hypothetical protein
MKVKLISGICAVMLIAVSGCENGLFAEKYQWEVHDMNRPQPVVVRPGIYSSQPPADAIVLFDGRNLSQWESQKGGPAKWKVENGYMEVIKKTGGIRTKRSFGDCQLHIEWATPANPTGKDQHRGNSGVFLMNTYEVQVLDSYNNPTYSDGLAGSLYGQKPPMVNACRRPGQWQSYDIIFRRPIFKGKKAVRPATITVLQNGVLVQDHWEIKGPTWHKRRSHYVAHGDKLPLSLQDHGDPVRYRNIWIRELPEK